MSQPEMSPVPRAEMYLRAFRIRAFEERCRELSAQGQISGSIHLCAGQEVVPVAARAALEDGDQVVATYRGHGWALACGVPVESLLAEICHRDSGINGGRGGSPHFSAPRYGFLGENSIVGAGVPMAAGASLAAAAARDGRVVLVSFGDGATNQGALHEGIVFAAMKRLPLILACENNGWSEMTPISETVTVRQLSQRAAAYGIPGRTVDGTDPDAVYAAVSAAAAAARAGQGPTFLEFQVPRLWGHYNRDIEHYRPRQDREAAQAADPVIRLRAALLTDQVLTETGLTQAEAAVRREIDQATAAVLAAALPDAAGVRRHVYAERHESAAASRDDAALAPAVTTELKMVQAITAALRRELSDRPDVLVFGEDVGVAGGVFGATRGLQREFGRDRVFDTPISESAILGAAVGAAMRGLRPVAEVMWADFLLVALDQLINQAANVRYVSRGELQAPLVVRTQQGVTPGSCAQHSQSLEALLVHIPGLKVGLPATPQDAYAMLRAAIADPDPCVIIEPRALYQVSGPVALEAPAEPVGGARLRREGADIALITWGSMLPSALQAAEALAGEEISVAVLDLRWLSPLDEDAIAKAVRAAGGKALIVHEANRTGGVGAEVAARITERLFADLTAPVMRLASPDSRIPAAPNLQQALVPSVASIVAAVKEVLGAAVAAA